MSPLWPSDMLARLPPELRLIIYELVLPEGMFFTLEHSGDQVSIHYQSCSSCKCSWDTFGAGILSTCRQYRTEAFPVLMTYNCFTYSSMAPPEPANRGNKHTLTFPGHYLRFIKYLTVVQLVEDEVYHQEYVDTLEFFRLLSHAGAQLDVLIMCTDSALPESGSFEYDLRSASSYVPTMFHMYVTGMVKQLWIGSYARLIPGTPGTTEYVELLNMTRLEAASTHMMMEHACQPISGHRGLRIFHAFYDLNEGMEGIGTLYSSTLDRLSTQDALHTLDPQSLIKGRSWDGRMLQLAPEVTEGTDDTQSGQEARKTHRHARLASMRTLDTFNLEALSYCWEEADEVVASVGLYDDLHQLQKWWQLWLAANVPSQTKLTQHGFTITPN